MASKNSTDGDGVRCGKEPNGSTHRDEINVCDEGLSSTLPVDSVAEERITSTLRVDAGEEASYAKGEELDNHETYGSLSESRKHKAKDYGELAEDDEGNLYWRAVTGSDEAEWKLATYLTTEVRRDMIKEMSKQGHYKTDRPIGPGVADETCFHPDQKDWGEARAERPDILFQFNKPDSRKGRLRFQPVPLFVYKTRIVIDKESRKPLRDFPNIPKCLSSVEEGWLLEAISRQDPRISHDDYSDRMPYDVRPDAKTISMRRSRFRWKTACKSWVTRSASDKINDYLDDLVPEMYQAANSTRDWRDLDQKEILEMKRASLGKFPERARKEKKTKGEGSTDKANRPTKAARGSQTKKRTGASKQVVGPLHAVQINTRLSLNPANEGIKDAAGSPSKPFQRHEVLGDSKSEYHSRRSGHRRKHFDADNSTKDETAQGLGIDFRHKAPSTSWEKRALQRALGPTRMAITQLLGRLTPPTDQCSSYLDQLTALYRYYAAQSTADGGVLPLDELNPYREVWLGGFPSALFVDDFDLPETFGSQV